MKARRGKLIIIVLCTLLSCTLASCGGDDTGQGTIWSVTSPDGRVTVVVKMADLGGTADYPAGENLYYRVLLNGTEALAWSPLGITLEGRDFLTDLAMEERTLREVNEPYEMLSGKSSAHVDHAREMILRFADVDGEGLEILFRAYDDGAAYRYRLLGAGPATVTGEHSGFRVPPADGWMQPHDFPGISKPAHERNYEKVRAGDESPRDGWGFPVLFRLDDTDSCLLITEAGLDRGYCGTRLAQTATDNVYRVRFPSRGEGLGRGEVNPTWTLPWATPWRVIILGELADVLESVMVDNLSAPPEGERDRDFSWVRPGRAAWSWWSQATGDEALQREYVDSAAEFGWEYILVDARWDQWPDPETQIPGLVDYAAEKGIGILLWYNSGGLHNLMLTETPRNRMLDPDVRRTEFDKLSDWGVKGVKVDFFHSDKQDRIQQYLDILSDAADTLMLVNFHGCTIPRGWQRRYPNLMTMEAVHGAESYKPFFVDRPTALNNVHLSFTRNVIGPMDYTPVTFAGALQRRGITYAHQLALSVIFESGLQHFADQADSSEDAGYRKVFGDYPFVGDFMRHVPAAWDETLLLDGDPDSHIVLARRKGEAWYVGGMNGLEDADLEVPAPLGFLGDGTYDMVLIRTGCLPDELVLEEWETTAAGTLTHTMGPRDGFVAYLTPAP
ncbi:glycoside hydrolase family 97 catalytic domain-containing protein [Thermodesulfobacteriota bacterium]